MLMMPIEYVLSIRIINCGNLLMHDLLKQILIFAKLIFNINY